MQHNIELWFILQTQLRCRALSGHPATRKNNLLSYWSGQYHSNSNQQVTRDDALEMAAALRRGIKDIPDMDISHETEKTFISIKDITEVLDTEFEFKLNENRASELLTFYSHPEERSRLINFIDFICEDDAGYNTGC